MKVYLVGGAVRDELLGLAVDERDWVVVGASPQALLDLGYKAVGKDFPVFLHPQTGEEYALARTERKTGRGYYGFEAYFAPDVTLEDDLRRRDLTVNAIAKDPETGQLIDPFGGVRDLQSRVLRHVSAAFSEDPLRVLRVARFAARFAPLGFTVAPETLDLMRAMSQTDELNALVPERVWQETLRALSSAVPWRYFEVLREVGALAQVFPELERLFGVPQPPQWHPEIDTGVHTFMVLEQATALSADPRVRFASLVHDLGKGTTPPEEWPRHVGHEERSVKLIEALCERLRVPRDFRELARIVARYHGIAHRADALRASTMVDALDKLDAYRRPERFEQFLVACEADIRGRTGFEKRDYPQAQRWRRAFELARAVQFDRERWGDLTGEEIRERLRQERIATLKRELGAH
ncbi:MAG TPA: multifunctional CCA addition/repair protein [Steroidobacteraceae bacterium]|nr:multifunctional CCA addition/repair protein [Steroidobacteraceae bacterium]